MLLDVAAITFKFYRKFYCTCDQSINAGLTPRLVILLMATVATLRGGAMNNTCSTDGDL